MPPRLHLTGRNPGRVVRLVATLLAIVAAAPSPASLSRGAGAGSGPRVGELAPPHGLRAWLQEKGAELADLRGQVVVLHTFAWNCDSCLRVGIPLSVALLSANPDDVRVVSITTPAEVEETRRVAAELRMSQPIALTNPIGGESPYVDIGNGFTYMWIVGRNGELVWRGDPSTKEEECLSAMSAAIADRGVRRLGRELCAELAEAAGLFARGLYSDAARAAEKLHRKRASKKDEDSRRIAADAAYLLERIADQRAKLVQALAQAATDRAADAYVALERELARGFRRDAEVSSALEAAADAMDEAKCEAAVAIAERWIELRAERPALYGVRDDKAAKKFTRRLRAFLEENGDAPQADAARSMLTRAESTR